MDQVLFAFSWMTFNSVLAIIPIIIVAWYRYNRHVWVKCVFACMWLAFVPNTLYVLTDPYHLILEWPKTPLWINLTLIPMYVALITIGIVTFFVSVKAFDKEIKKYIAQKSLHFPILVALNTVIGMGISLGRVERINSWEIITNIPNTIGAGVHMLTAPIPLLITLVCIFTVNALYFSVSSLLTSRKISKQ